MPKVKDPSQELRFSRTGQALGFALVGSLALSAGVTLALVTWTVYRSPFGMDQHPFPLWLHLLPWLVVGLCIWLVLHCLRHPYLILSPIGVEVFPFWRPIQNFHLIEWGRIADLEVTSTALTLHYNAQHTGGVVLALTPLHKKSRILLMQTINGIIDQRKV